MTPAPGLGSIQYIAPMVDGVISILNKLMPTTLPTGYAPFQQIDIEFTGIAPNPPQAWVMPVRTSMDDDGTSTKEVHLLTVRFAVAAADPDELATAAMVYMKAISDALNAAQSSNWGTVAPFRIFVYQHDYGPLFQKDGVMMRFPELHLQLDVEEV